VAIERNKPRGPTRPVGTAVVQKETGIRLTGQAGLRAVRCAGKPRRVVLGLGKLLEVDVSACNANGHGLDGSRSADQVDAIASAPPSDSKRLSTVLRRSGPSEAVATRAEQLSLAEAVESAGVALLWYSSSVKA